jgi:ribosome biogenesis GTPase A
MRCAKHPIVRNKIDLTDPNQVRAWRRRLEVSTDDLQRVVVSISAVTKEIELERMPANTLQADG